MTVCTATTPSSATCEARRFLDSPTPASRAARSLLSTRRTHSAPLWSTKPALASTAYSSPSRRTGSSTRQTSGSITASISHSVCRRLTSPGLGSDRNEARLGFNRIFITFTPNRQLNPADFGINNGVNQPIGLPQINVTGSRFRSERSPPWLQPHIHHLHAEQAAQPGRLRDQ